MPKTQAFATKLPVDLTLALTDVCARLGLKKNYVVETALRDKLEDLMDTEDLKLAVHEATGFQGWDDVKKELKRKR